MRKINVLWIVMESIFLIIFNFIFFILGGTAHNASVWISYGFIHFAYFMLLLTPVLTRKGKSSSVFGLSIYGVSSVYFFIELITGVIFILVSPSNYQAALLVQLIFVGLYGIILIANMIANERTAEAEEERENQIAYVKDASNKLKSILSNINDKDTKKKVERVYDTICSSPVKSYPSLTQIENQILQLINDLETTIYAGDKDRALYLTNSLLDAASERNIKLKSLN